MVCTNGLIILSAVHPRTEWCPEHAPQLELEMLRTGVIETLLYGDVPQSPSNTHGTKNYGKLLTPCYGKPPHYITMIPIAF